MAVLDIVLYPDDRLRAKCKPVESFDDELQALIDDMIETMYDAPGIGLAAPQVGRDLQLTVIDTRDREKPDPDNPGLLVLINPRIVEKSSETLTWEEGCLSIPGVFDDVTRPKRVVVEALDRHGEPFTIEGEELLAICLQHEIDHLKGVLFLDYLSRLKMRMAMKTYKRTKAGYLADLKKKREEKGDPA
ncbi:MAG: peptide deformylase [Myxococcales bacterium]|nr:peptide deformylase [Myxococcales bacterium]